MKKFLQIILAIAILYGVTFLYEMYTTRSRQICQVYQNSSIEYNSSPIPEVSIGSKTVLHIQNIGAKSNSFMLVNSDSSEIHLIFDNPLEVGVKQTASYINYFGRMGQYGIDPDKTTTISVTPTSINKHRIKLKIVGALNLRRRTQSANIRETRKLENLGDYQFYWEDQTRLKDITDNYTFKILSPNK